MQVVRPYVVHVYIVYRWLVPFPIRYEFKPGQEAVLDLVRDDYGRGELRWKLVAWATPGNMVRAWTSWEAAVWDCRHGLTFTFTGGIPDIMRPLVKARLAEVVIGPHCTLSYGVHDEQVAARGMWPIPPRPAFFSRH